jgi:hypothetical protein
VDRCAIFVDAGYLYAAGGLLCCGTKKRADIACDQAELVKMLSGLVRNDCGLDVLRAYWYDAARDAIPAADHLVVAQLANVKLRLGRLTHRGQKGVDSMIVRDLMTLARERAIATAYLLSGDEDLREGVMAAQDMGVRVSLLGVRAERGFNQSPTLVREADEVVILEREHLEPHMRVREVAGAEELSAERAAEVPSAPEGTGAAFAAEWAARATREEILELLGRAPRIPGQIDAQLLRAGEAAHGAGMRDQQELRQAVREGFWRSIRQAAAGPQEKGPRTGAPPKSAEANSADA